MITEITIKGFKSLEQVELELGSLNIFVGSNASGKSNFLDALRLLQGIGYGFTIDEVLNGKPKGPNSEVWEPIRGGSSSAGFMKWNPQEQRTTRRLVRISVGLSAPIPSVRSVSYSILISARDACVRGERLFVGANPIFDSRPIDNRRGSPVFRVRYYAGRRGRQPHLQFEKSRPVLHQLLHHRSCTEEHAPLIEACIRLLANTQRLDPSPSILSEYSKTPFVGRMGERGENFAALVNSILKEEKTASAYNSWLKQLTPIEMEEVSILHGALQEPLFALKERGETFPAPILSDGTLRFAAIAAAFFQPDMPDTLMIEEIENCIHPTRLRLLLELLKSRAHAVRPQIMATTHSPVVLAWLKETDYKTTFFCKRDEETGASLIRPLTEVPKFTELARKQPVSELFAEGWLEGAL